MIRNSPLFASPPAAHGSPRQRAIVFLAALIALLLLWSRAIGTDASDEPETPAVQAGATTSTPAGESGTDGEKEPIDAGAGVRDRKLPTTDEPAAKRPVELAVLKLIPDQKAFIGSPDTIIELKDVFSDTEIDKDDGQLTFHILETKNSKESVAEARIEGYQLVLAWGRNTKKKSEITVVARNAAGESIRSKFYAQLWEPDYWKLALTVIGGLGIFLLGMKNMSEGLQAVAGGGLRRMISAVTDNRFLATGVGTAVTMLIQSSSITTVMVVGFVNSGFMTLAQAIGVIMGANIGTTITGWILALKVGAYGLPLTGVGAIVYLFARSDRWRYLAMAAMGLGMVFFGLQLMKDGFAIIKDLPAFEAWFKAFSAVTYLGVLKCALVGCVLTFIVQSSSATLGITIGLAQIGVIEFETAAALVLGENIGTTITALLASFGTTTNARRAAYFHIVFNMIGVFWITSVFQWYVPIIRYVATGEIDGDVSTDRVAWAIAATHTGFNLTNMLLFLPFTRFFAAFLHRFVPDKPAREKPHLTNLDVRMLETPVIGIEQSRVELLRMGDGCNKMMDWLKEIATSNVPQHRLVKKTFHREEVLDTVQDEIVKFLGNMLSGNVPHEIIDEGRRQLRMADEYESVSDYVTDILKSHLKLENEGLRFDADDQGRLLELHDEVADYLQFITHSYELRQCEVMTKANSLGDAIKRRVKGLRSRFLNKVFEQSVHPMVNVAYNAQITSYRHVRDHVLNIAEALAGVK